ncbi:MAG: DUF3306 domain-containing protein [Pseudomonadota bacterium]
MTETRSDFWSRRKARVQQERDADQRAEEAAHAEQRAAELSEKSDEEILAELNLPDPDSLRKGDDFSVFMKQAVPERLRRRALRRLWLSNPVLANLDALVEYGEDYTDAATVVENLSTAYQVGKGMMAHVLEMERQAAEADGEDQSVANTTDQMSDREALDAESDAPVVEPRQEPPTTMVAVEETPVSADSFDEELAVAPSRRMRFAFAE